MPREKLLLLIGIDDYDGTICPTLNNAVFDVSSFGKIMESRYGFTIFKELYNQDATRTAIVETLDFLCDSASQDSDIIIYFAGHGGQLAHSKTGYWAAIDYKKISDRIDNSSVYNSIDGMFARHIILISDSCYSGTFITRTRDNEFPEYSIETLEETPSRWVLVSGAEKPVSDGKFGKGSPFGIKLCDYLEKNLIPKIPSGWVFEHVCKTVRKITHSKQMPNAAEIDLEANEGGQMVFSLIQNRTRELKNYVKPSFSIPELPFEYYIARTVTYYEHQRDEISYFYQSERGRSYLIDTLQTHRKIVLLGSAGSGKSVELIHLAHSLKDSSDLYVPLYKRFNTYTGQKIEDYLPKKWDQVDPEAQVILIDGLDEIQNQFFFTAISNIIEFTDNNPAIRIIISCRTNFYELPSSTFSGTIQNFSVFTLNDLSPNEIKTYATEQLNLDGQVFIENVYETSFLDLIQKPFFLNLITQYYIQNGVLIREKRAQILKEAILNYYLNDKEHFNTTGFPLSKPEVFYRLEKIAFIMEVMGKNFITDDELYQIFPNTKDFENCKFLPAFRRQDDKNQWMFEHNNIQEFLAATVLSKTSLAKILDIISISSAGSLKVRPTWVNTISFFVNIDNTEKSKKLLDWIISNDVEIIIRFEPDRVNKEKRIQIFKNIFESYSKKQIWLSSNKFSDSDLARFGCYAEVVEYLLIILKNKETPRIIQLNAIKVLQKFKMSDFKSYSLTVKKALIELLENAKFSNYNTYDTYSILNALTNLDFTDRETLDLIITKFRKHKNQYIRAGLYKLLLHSEFLNEHVDILIEGLDLTKIKNPIEDRESVNLMDESFHLTGALKKINSSESLKQLLTFFTDEKTKGIYLSDHKEIMASLIENSIQIYEKDKTIYNYIRNLFLLSVHLYPNGLEHLIKPFFDATQTSLKTFLFIWENDEISNFVKTELTETILSKKIFESFLDKYQKGEYNNNDATNLHHILFIRERVRPDFIEFRTELEAFAKDRFGLILKVPDNDDWAKIYRERNQSAFDILFNPERLLKEVNKIFIKTDKKIFQQEDLYNFHSTQFDQPEEVAVSSALDLLRDFTYQNKPITLKVVSEFIHDKVRFEAYQTNQIYEFLHRSNSDGLVVSTKQLDFIIEWCKTNGSDIKILWFFIQKFKIHPSEEKILSLTTYYDFNNEVKIEEPGTIEQLEDFIDKKKLLRRVVENLSKNAEDSFSWLSNAGYALRNNIQEIYTGILNYLKQVKNNEYKYSEVLQFWFVKTNDFESLQVFIETVYSDILRWKAIALLYNTENKRDFLQDYLRQYMNNSDNSIEYRFMAANFLMEMNDIEGLDFCTKYILERKDPLFRYQENLSKMKTFKNSDGLPSLMKLLHLSKQEEFQKDTFNSLETIVIDTLFNMGISSDMALVEVRSAISTFITSYSEEFKDLNFLNITIQRMEDQLNVKKSQNINISEAIEQWERYIH